MTEALKARDQIRTSTLRMLLSAIQYFEIAKKSSDYSATDEEVMDVIRKEVKKRTQAIGMYQKGSRQDLADKESKERDILTVYLPAQMDDKELQAIVQSAIEQSGAKEPSDMGKVMALVMQKAKGKADGTKVKNLVQSLLKK